MEISSYAIQGTFEEYTKIVRETKMVYVLLHHDDLRRFSSLRYTDTWPRIFIFAYLPGEFTASTIFMAYRNTLMNFIKKYLVIENNWLKEGF